MSRSSSPLKPEPKPEWKSGWFANLVGGTNQAALENENDGENSLAPDSIIDRTVSTANITESFCHDPEMDHNVQYVQPNAAAPSTPQIKYLSTFERLQASETPLLPRMDHEPPGPVINEPSPRKSTIGREMNKTRSLSPDHTRALLNTLTLTNGTSLQLLSNATLKEHNRMQRWQDTSRGVGKLAAKQMDVLGVRVKAQEARTALRRDREALSNLEAGCMSTMRTLFARNTSSEVLLLLQHCEELQNARDELQRKEDDYNILEDELNQQEFELHDSESKLFARLKSARNSLLGNEVPESLEDEASVSGSGLNTLGEHHSPLQVQYFSRLGDEDQVKEQLAELRARRVHLVEAERARAQFGLKIDDDSERFLKNFDRQHEALQRDLANVRRDLARLQDLLATTSNAMMYNLSQFSETTAWSHEVVVEHSSPDLLSQFEDIEPDPLLLAPEDANSTFNAGFPGPPSDAIDTITFIGVWLLGRLRRSTLEILRFKSAEPLRNTVLGGVELRDFVIDWWFKDDLSAQRLIVSNNLS